MQSPVKLMRMDHRGPASSTEPRNGAVDGFKLSDVRTRNDYRVDASYSFLDRLDCPTLHCRHILPVTSLQQQHQHQSPQSQLQIQAQIQRSQSSSRKPPQSQVYSYQFQGAEHEEKRAFDQESRTVVNEVNGDNENCSHELDTPTDVVMHGTIIYEFRDSMIVSIAHNGRRFLGTLLTGSSCGYAPTIPCVCTSDAGNVRTKRRACYSRSKSYGCYPRFSCHQVKSILHLLPPEDVTKGMQSSESAEKVQCIACSQSFPTISALQSHMHARHAKSKSTGKKKRKKRHRATTRGDTDYRGRTGDGVTGHRHNNKRRKVVETPINLTLPVSQAFSLPSVDQGNNKNNSSTQSDNCENAPILEIQEDAPEISTVTNCHTSNPPLLTPIDDCTDESPNRSHPS